MPDRKTDWACQQCGSQVTIEQKQLTNLLPDRYVLYCNCSLVVAETIGRRNMMDKLT